MDHAGHDDDHDHDDHDDHDGIDLADLVDRVHGLSDLELAVLLSLVSREHCVIGTPVEGVGHAVDELYLIATRVFGLSCVVIDCHEQMTLSDFQAAVLLPPTPPASRSGHRQPRVSFRSTANVVLAKHLNRASDAVQIQALELLRAGGSLTLPASHPLVSRHARSSFATALGTDMDSHDTNGGDVRCPPDITIPQSRPFFLFIPVVATDRGFLGTRASKNDTFAADARRASVLSASSSSIRPPETRLSCSPPIKFHLNDHFAMGHWHDPEDGYANIEEARDYENDHGHPYDDADTLAPSPPPLFSPADILHLGSLSRQTRIDMAVLRYQHNLVAFLRMHRAVAVIGNGPDCAGASSASPTATKHFEKLARCLAPLHRLDYVTPALVALALRKIYLHRIRIIRGTKTDGYGDGVSGDALHERSMQWGSSRAAVEAVLEGITPEDVIEDVLQVVPAPL